MNRTLIAIFLLCFSFNLFADSESLTGTYVDQPANDAGCELKVHQINEQALRFELSCNRGAPSYNSGLAFGMIELKGLIATYTRMVSGLCVIQFQFKPNAVDVIQTGSSAECGFGWKVYADGSYSLINNKTPEFKYK